MRGRVQVDSIKEAQKIWKQKAVYKEKEEENERGEGGRRRQILRR